MKRNLITYDNNNPDHRILLVEALKERGIPAFEWNSGGGIYHVIVPLISDSESNPEINSEDSTLVSIVLNILKRSSYNPFLFIATNSLRTSCDIGLMGEDPNTGDQVGSINWIYAAELKGVIKQIQKHWDKRDILIKSWVEGSLK